MIYFLLGVFLSIRFVFLNKGSRIISIGSIADPNREFNDDQQYTRFFEIPKYFSSADFKVLKYHVNSTNEHEFVRGDTSYNANVRVDLVRIERLVRQALWEHIADIDWQGSMASK